MKRGRAGGGRTGYSADVGVASVSRHAASLLGQMAAAPSGGGSRSRMSLRLEDGFRWGSFSGQFYPTPGGYSYEQLRDVVLATDILLTAISARASAVADNKCMIHRVDGAVEVSSGNKAFLAGWVKDSSMWRAGGGTGGIQEVFRRVLSDRYMFGAGVMEMLPPDSEVAYIRDARVAGVAHIPRANTRILRPKVTRRAVGGVSYSEYDKDDIVYPRMIYSAGGIGPAGLQAGAPSDLRYLKSFGDERQINAYTGEVGGNAGWEDMATEYMRMVNYVSGYEGGWPEWYSAVKHVDIIDAGNDYFRSMLRNNGIPDLAVVLKGASIDDEYVRRLENKFRKIGENRAGSEKFINIVVFSLVRDELGEDDDDEALPEMDMDITRLNPMDGNIIRALMSLRERAEQRVASALRVPNQMLNFERNTGLGSGAEITSAMVMFLKLVVVPEQSRIHAMLDRITSEGLGITDYQIRLKAPSYNEPETEARIAKLWSTVMGLTIDELRDKSGLLPMRDGLKPTPGIAAGSDVGKVMIIPPGNAALPLSALKAVLTAAYGPGSVSSLLGGGAKPAAGPQDKQADGGVDDPPDGVRNLSMLPEGSARSKLREDLRRWFPGLGRDASGEDYAAVIADIESVVARARKQAEEELEG